MENLDTFFRIFVGLQIVHSLEEIFTNFSERWPVWKMSRNFFILFEVGFVTLLIIILIWVNFPFRQQLMLLFNLLMFANGIWHTMWAAIEKKYVPGLFTATLFIITFLFFYTLQFNVL